ncbi:ABC transporter ATP-binding protein [Aldersonia kunmingensis]|uniref:ABC transporter ATP-binding protein n=1 Tax=Aldersonia kunmingensis TaxID=408066 RepID=UPI000836F863|nr:ABC transporter ATP-binding protein [Aldersonia kunmingensis]
MIRTLLTLLPADERRTVWRFATLAIISVIARAAGVVLLVPLVAALIDGHNDDAVAWLAALTVATIIGWAVDAMASRLGYDLGFGLLNSAQHGVAERLSRIRLTWFTGANTATARQAIAATGPDLVGVIIYLVVPVLSALLLPVAIAIALIPIQWQLALVALAGVPLLLGSMWATTAITQKAEHTADEANTRLNERVVEFARTQATLRVSRRVEPERSLAGDALAQQHGATVRLLLMQVPGQLLFSIASQVALFALAATAAWLTVDGDLGTAQAVALIVVAVRYLEPFTALAGLAPGLESTRLTLRRIGAVLDGPLGSPGENAYAVSGSPRIEFDHVTFRYGDTDQAVLDDLSLVFEPGTTTAIVGPSGSGKSTILALIAGLQEPDSGRVLVDGVDIATLAHETRRALSSVVFQQPYLFAGSIEENILAGDPAATPDRIAEAGALARVDEIVERLPDGMRSEVGEGGAVLSGGERQRISIARALLKPAPILLIDEATSALDNENERAVVDALSADDIARTRVIVAHRQAGIRRADRVVVIEDGRVTESGTPADLRAAGGAFAKFWEHQGAAASWKLTEVPID